MRTFPFVQQHDAMQCGIACIAMICKSYGKRISTSDLERLCHSNKQGVTMKALVDTCKEIGFDVKAGRINVASIEFAPLPCIIYWNQKHFVVLYRIKKGKKFYVADPGKGLDTYGLEEFKQHWISSNSNGEDKGIVMFLETTPAFFTYKTEGEESIKEKRSFRFLLGYVKKCRKYFGQINIGNTDINKLNKKWWRRQCGVVMQDGVIFSESIARNIAVDDGDIDKERLLKAAEIACIKDYVLALPLKFNTKIGRDGVGLSQGQKQRILIARAVYKNPDYIFLDEATNSLDANNERSIVENLDKFYKGKTVVIVAHRLSTVKNADQIVVIDHGKVVEVGNHESLTAKRGEVFVPYKYLYLFDEPRTAHVSFEGNDNTSYNCNIISHNAKLLHREDGNYFMAIATVSTQGQNTPVLQKYMKADVRIIVSNKTLWQQVFG